VPTQQRFEGPTLEAALEEVRATVGDDAVIAGANRLRKGGIAGFFARDSYEVLVDVDEDGDAELPPAAANARPEPMSLLELAETVSDEEARAALDSNPLDFDAVLNQVVRSETRPLVARPRAAAMPVMPAIEERMIDDEIVIDERPTMEPMMVEPMMVEPAMVGAPMVVPATVAPIAPSPARRAPRHAPRPAVIEHAAPALVELGLPDQLARRNTRTTDPERSIAAALEQLPQPDALPSSAGCVIAVVGERPNALQLARSIAERLGLDRDSVVLATESNRPGRSAPANRLSSPTEAFDHRRSWRRRKRPVVVAIDCAVGRSTTSWAESVLDALEPSMTWATIDAHRKPEDVSDWARRLGGVDALAVRNLHDTASPAAVLRTGIPVGFLDGETATPYTWARLLVDRIAA
jgi:hypothetical protein